MTQLTKSSEHCRTHGFRGYSRQRGMTLVELMVAMFLGLLVIGMGLSTILLSRTLSATTSDVSALQQQAAFAFRTMGLQVRQAGSLELDLGVVSIPTDRVAYLVNYQDISDIISGTDNPTDSDYLKVGYRNYDETITDPAGGTQVASQLRDCLGEGVGADLIESRFQFKPSSGSDATGKLVCQGAGAAPVAQEIIRNVADFQVRYLLQSNAATSNPQMQRVKASGIGSPLNWSRVVGVEVCLDMVGDERIDGIGGETYEGCDPDAGQLPYGDRTHMVFRNVFQIRPQGIVAGKS